MSKPTLLSDVTTDEIVAELHARFPALLIAAERDAQGRADAQEVEFWMCWRGSLTHAIGLAERAKSRLNRRAVVPDEGGAT